MLVHAYYPSTGRLRQEDGKLEASLELYSKFKAMLSYTVRVYL
jgi:hypothetical protein